MRLLSLYLFCVFSAVYATSMAGYLWSSQASVASGGNEDVPMASSSRDDPNTSVPNGTDIPGHPNSGASFYGAGAGPGAASTSFSAYGSTGRPPGGAQGLGARATLAPAPTAPPPQPPSGATPSVMAPPAHQMGFPRDPIGAGAGAGAGPGASSSSASTIAPMDHTNETSVDTPWKDDMDESGGGGGGDGRGTT